MNTVLIFNENDFREYASSNYNYKNDFFVFSKKIDVCDKVSKYIILENFIEYEYLEDFFINVSLAVAQAEALESKQIFIPKEIHKTDEYYENIKDLIIKGTMKKIEVCFYNTMMKNTSQILLNNLDNVDNKCLVLFSGGIDCAIASELMLVDKKEVTLLSFNYNQRNLSIEEKFSINQFDRFKKKYKEVNLLKYDLKKFYSKIAFSSGLLNIDIKLNNSNATLEYVPFRNTVMIAIAAYICKKKGISKIITGSHADDGISPDNSPQYYDLINKFLKCDNTISEISVVSILNYIGGKPEIIKIGEKLDVDFSICWTCHLDAKIIDNNIYQCGECSDCSTRYSAFKKINKLDPLKYSKKPIIRENWSGWIHESKKILENYFSEEEIKELLKE